MSRYHREAARVQVFLPSNNQSSDKKMQPALQPLCSSPSNTRQSITARCHESIPSCFSRSQPYSLAQGSCILVRLRSARQQVPSSGKAPMENSPKRTLPRSFSMTPPHAWPRCPPQQAPTHRSQFERTQQESIELSMPAKRGENPMNIVYEPPVRSEVSVFSAQAKVKTFSSGLGFGACCSR